MKLRFSEGKTMVRYLPQGSQEPFMHQLASTYRGKRLGKRKNGQYPYLCECPQCHKKKALFFANEEATTYVLCCANRDQCGFVMNLHQLITERSSGSIREEYLKDLKENEKRYVKDRRSYYQSHPAYRWNPIKNPKKNSHKGGAGKHRHISYRDLHTKWVMLKFLGVLEKHIIPSQMNSNDWKRLFKDNQKKSIFKCIDALYPDEPMKNISSA